MNLSFGKVEFFSSRRVIDFMSLRTLFVTFSTVLVLISLGIIFVKGINYSIDFRGGAELTVTLAEKSSSNNEIQKIASQFTKEAISISEIASSDSRKMDGRTFQMYVTLSLGGVDEETQAVQLDKLKEQFLGALKEQFGESIRLDGVVISPKMGAEERERGVWAVVASLIAILVYVAFRFDMRFAPGAVLCLAHDVIISLGFVTLLGLPFSNMSITALLTLVGYSINDTIVIYDRIREMVAENPRENIAVTINKSISQTMNRTLLTGTSTLIALVILGIWGGGSIQSFAITMLVGVIVGTYSSVYVATPLTIMIDGFLRSHGINLSNSFNRVKVEKDPNYIPPVVVRKTLPTRSSP